jgi:predicted Zn-dependent protease
MMAVLGVALALGAPASGPATSKAPAYPAAQGHARGLSAEAVLALRAEELPRAPAGAWSGWSEESGLPDQLREGYMQALAAWRAGDVPAVLAATWPLLEASPDHPALLHLAGHAQFRLRRYGECAQLLERFVVHVPQQVGRTRHLGHAWNELGQVERARAHYDRVLEAAAADHEARRGRALALWRLGRVEEALADLAVVVAARPRHAEAWLLRARILVDEEEAEAALGALERHQALDPFEPEAAFLRARALQDLGRADEAAAARVEFDDLEAVAAAARPLEGNLLLRPHDLLLHRALAEVRLGAGQVPLARAALVSLAREARLGVGVGLEGGLARAQLAWAQEQLARLGESAERSAR